jgi:NTP pyrophosphatase (non-canonical NTP hydrolase)
MDLTKKLNKFQKESGATAEVYSQIDAISIWGLGCWDEGGEVGGLFKKYIGHGHSLDMAGLMKELGDSLWYVARVADWLGVELGAVWYDAKALETGIISTVSKFSYKQHLALDCLSLMATGSAGILEAARRISREGNDPHNINLFHGLKKYIRGLKSLLNIYEVDLLEVIKLNQAKLKTRYADGFTPAASMARVDVEQPKSEEYMWHLLYTDKKGKLQSKMMDFKDFEEAESWLKGQGAKNWDASPPLKNWVDTKTPLPNWEDVDPIPYKQKPISLKCYNCRVSYPSNEIKYCDSTPYCDQCYAEGGECPSCGSYDLFHPITDTCSNCDSGEDDPNESDCVGCAVAEGVLSYDGDLFCEDCYKDVLALAGAWVCGCGSAMSEEQRINFGVCERCFNQN